MATTILKTAAQIKHNRIFRTIKNLNVIPGVTIELIGDSIKIKHTKAFVPDFELIWRDDREFFHVYLHVGDKGLKKVCAGYTIFCIDSPLVASEFVSFYHFIYRNRSCNKTDSFTE